MKKISTKLKKPSSRKGRVIKGGEPSASGEKRIKLKAKGKTAGQKALSEWSKKWGK